METTFCTEVRSMTHGDIHYLLNIDVKVSEFSWGLLEWNFINEFFDSWMVTVGILHGEPKGFAVWEIDQNDDVARIHKFAVHPSAKKIGLDNSILDDLNYQSTRKGLGEIEFYVSEYNCGGENDPYDISGWLLEKGFKCVGIDRDIFLMYGRSNDAFKFRKPVIYGDHNE